MGRSRSSSCSRARAGGHNNRREGVRVSLDRIWADQVVRAVGGDTAKPLPRIRPWRDEGGGVGGGGRGVGGLPPDGGLGEGLWRRGGERVRPVATFPRCGADSPADPLAAAQLGEVVEEGAWRRRWFSPVSPDAGDAGDGLPNSAPSCGPTSSGQACTLTPLRVAR